jgi:hypothetical protein
MDDTFDEYINKTIIEYDIDILKFDFRVCVNRTQLTQENWDLLKYSIYNKTEIVEIEMKLKENTWCAKPYAPEIQNNSNDVIECKIIPLEYCKSSNDNV